MTLPALLSLAPVEVDRLAAVAMGWSDATPFIGDIPEGFAPWFVVLEDGRVIRGDRPDGQWSPTTDANQALQVADAKKAWRITFGYGGLDMDRMGWFVEVWSPLIPRGDSQEIASVRAEGETRELALTRACLMIPGEGWEE